MDIMSALALVFRAIPKKNKKYLYHVNLNFLTIVKLFELNLFNRKIQFSSIPH